MDIARERKVFRQALRERGLAATRQRLTIADVVFATHVHFTPDELFARVRRRDPRIGRVTVYRTLHVLAEAGLVEKQPVRREVLAYEHVTGHAHHDHMVCLQCGRIIEFSSPLIEQVQAETANRYGFQTVRHRHTLLGYCRKCARMNREPAATERKGAR